MKAASLTAPFRAYSEALSPNNVANKLVEVGFRAGGQLGATGAGVIGALAGGYATAAVFEKLNPLTAVSNMISDVNSAQSLGAKAGAIIGGGLEVLVDVAVPAMTLAFSFESLDAAAQAWDKPAARIDIKE